MRYTFVIIFLCFIGCNNKQAEQKPTVLSLRNMSDLATVEYTVTKIIKANDNQTWFKVGDRKILMSCEATIKAGIDLASISKENYTVNGKEIQLRLPPPKIISINMPAEKIKVEYEETGLFRQPFSSAERDQLAAQAEAQIKNSVDSLGILDQAKVNTSLFIQHFLQQLGYQNIQLTYTRRPTSNTLP